MKVEMFINDGQVDPDRRYFSNQHPSETYSKDDRESYYMNTSRWVELGSPGKITVTVEPAGDVDYEVKNDTLTFREVRPDGFSSAWDNTPLGFNTN